MKLFAAVSVIAALMVIPAHPDGAQESVHGVWQIEEISGHDPEAGAWRTENVQPSLYMFMDGYYSIMLVRGNEARPSMPQGTTWDSMTLEQYRSVCSGEFFSANSGTYEVTGSSLTVRPMVAKWPNLMEGGSQTFAYRLEGDILSLDHSGEDWSWNARLRRLR